MKGRLGGWEAGRLLARGFEGLGLTLAQAAALKRTDARKNKPKNGS
jgi:hypothetical protein